MNKSVKQRLAEKTIVAENGCHEWTGCLVANGYGQIHHNGKTAYAHRVAWEIHNGSDPGEDYILHRCDNRKCLNPEHLFLGSFDENMADMVSKNRQAHGERNGRAKLMAAQVRQIRALEGTQSAIADKFSISPSLVSMIKNRRIWKFV